MMAVLWLLLVSPVAAAVAFVSSIVTTAIIITASATVAQLLLLLLLLELLQLLLLLEDVMRGVLGDGVNDCQMPIQIPGGVKRFVAEMTSQAVGRSRPSI